MPTSARPTAPLAKIPVIAKPVTDVTGCGNPFSSSLKQGYYGWSCSGAQNFCAALRRTLEILTAATRSPRFLRHRRRSIRSPHRPASPAPLAPPTGGVEPRPYGGIQGVREKNPPVTAPPCQPPCIKKAFFSVSPFHFRLISPAFTFLPRRAILFPSARRSDGP